MLNGCTPKTPQAAVKSEAAEPDAKTSASGKDGDKTVALDPVAEKTAEVQTEIVRAKRVQNSLTVPGVVQTLPDRVAKITPPVAGKVRRVLVQIGATVREGQPLVVLSSNEVAQAQAAIRQATATREQSATLAQTAQTAVAQARSRLVSVQITLRRQQELARAGAFRQAPIQAAQTEMAQAESDLLQNEADLQNRTAIAQRKERLFNVGVYSRQDWEQAQTEQRQAQIRVEQNRKRFTLAQQTLTREKTVFQRDLFSQQQVQTAQADVRQAQGEVRRAQTEYQTAQTNLQSANRAIQTAQTNLRVLSGGGIVGPDGNITLCAPLAGVVSQYNITLGEAVSANTSLLTLENRQVVAVQASVPEAQVADVRIGQAVTITAAPFPNRLFRGIVQSIANSLDEKTRTLTVRCRVANADGLLRPEMFAQVQIATSVPRRVITVPPNALVRGESDQNPANQSIFVATTKGYEKRSVTTGGIFDSRVEIRRGLNVGEKVVISGAYTLKSESRKGELKEEE